MKAIALVIVLVVATACAVDTSTNTTEQPICTQEDIDNGTCGDPGGGSPPAEDPSLAAPPTVVNTWDVYAATVARDSSSVSCGVPRIVGLAYECVGDNARCVLTTSGLLFCSYSCFNTDAVPLSYQCPAWRNRPRY